MDKEIVDTETTSNVGLEVASQKPLVKSVEEINEAYSSDSWWYDLRGLFILTFAYRTNIISLRISDLTI
jgi:hypothetical protein